jgi:hypothetical protein
MCHLLTVFLNNSAEHEKYYLSNVLKKPQRVGIRQFVQHIEQLNAYVVQLPCWYYSLSYATGMMPANVPFSKADLASHVLQMCLHQWQDQYNLCMTPMDMRSLQASPKTIEQVCTPEKAHGPCGKNASQKSKEEPSSPVLEPQSRLPRKSVLSGPTSCVRHMGVRILRMLPKIATGTRKTER